MPPPAIHRSALTASGKDALIGQMAPQPTVKSSHGEAQLDSFLGCHQWLALGFETDPASMLSSRDLAILEALGARFVCLNGLGPAKSPRTLALALRQFAHSSRGPRSTAFAAFSSAPTASSPRG